MITFEDLQARLAITPEERHVLLHATAEALALPHLACGHRSCRREQRCDFVDPERGEPACLARLSPDLRAGFDALFALVVEIAENRNRRIPSADPDRLAEEHAAIAIVRASLHLLPKSGLGAALWIRAYRDPPPSPPPVDISAFRAEIRAELEAGRRLLSRAERADLGG
jgi:hypothetical protein